MSYVQSSNNTLHCSHHCLSPPPPVPVPALTNHTASHTTHSIAPTIVFHLSLLSLSLPSQITQQLTQHNSQLTATQCTEHNSPHNSLPHSALNTTAHTAHCPTPNARASLHMQQDARALLPLARQRPSRRAAAAHADACVARHTRSRRWCGVPHIPPDGAALLHACQPHTIQLGHAAAAAVVVFPGCNEGRLNRGHLRHAQGVRRDLKVGRRHRAVHPQHPRAGVGCESGERVRIETSSKGGASLKAARPCHCQTSPGRLTGGARMRVFTALMSTLYACACAHGRTRMANELIQL
eukprot:365232-Chlamydomonas_euryale.AAC.6